LCSDQTKYGMSEACPLPNSSKIPRRNYPPSKSKWHKNHSFITIATKPRKPPSSPALGTPQKLEFTAANTVMLNSQLTLFSMLSPTSSPSPTMVALPSLMPHLGIQFLTLICFPLSKQLPSVFMKWVFPRVMWF